MDNKKIDLSELKKFFCEEYQKMKIGDIRQYIINWLANNNYNNIPVCLDVYVSDDNGACFNIDYLDSDKGTVDNVYWDGDFLTVGIDVF